MSGFTKARLWLVLTLGAAVAAACFSDRTATSTEPGEECAVPLDGEVFGTESVLVAIRGFAFEPKTVSIRRGATVTWVNCEPPNIDPHTSTSDDGVWDSPFMAPGGRFSVTFDEAGDFAYHCVPHPFMTGVVSVEP